VEVQRRHAAQHRPGHPRRHGDEVRLGVRELGEAVDAARHLDEHAGITRHVQVARVDARLEDRARACGAAERAERGANGVDG
jgi:hypothetical protein